MMNIRQVIIYHQVDRGADGQAYGEHWLLDGVSKKYGMAAHLPAAGWEWIRGYKCAGIWSTKIKSQVDYCVEHGIPMIESKI